MKGQKWNRNSEVGQEMEQDRERKKEVTKTHYTTKYVTTTILRCTFKLDVEGGWRD